MIRQATAIDIPAIAALEKDLYSPEHYPELFLYQALQQWPSLLWVAAQHEQVVGYVLGAPGETTGDIWLMSLLVAPDTQGSGIGKALLQQFLTKLKQRNDKVVYLTVAPDNNAALALYKNHGFIELGNKPHLLGNNNHRLLLSCTL
ncbi:MAG: GNAT family N-acetyltransferase [Idiomarina sp.]